MRTAIVMAAGLILSPVLATASDNPTQPAIDACIDLLVETGGATRPGGRVIAESWSQAGSLVYLEDGDGRVWSCLGYDDGTVEALEPADEAGIAQAREWAAIKASYAPEPIRFEPGTTGTEITRTLDAGGAKQFTLGAQEGQTIYLRVVPENGAMYYIIRNPDGSILLGGTDAAQDYRGRLRQTGDHVVEVVSKESAPVTFDLIVGIE